MNEKSQIGNRQLAIFKSHILTPQQHQGLVFTRIVISFKGLREALIAL
jgi:hypothetical protein